LRLVSYVCFVLYFCSGFIPKVLLTDTKVKAQLLAQDLKDKPSQPAAAAPGPAAAVAADSKAAAPPPPMHSLYAWIEGFDEFDCNSMVEYRALQLHKKWNFTHV
jgi:hypothetical protein